MQLSTTSKIDGKPSMVVDYYPVKLPFGDISKSYILKVVSFQGAETMSKKFITKKEFVRECDERIGMGFEVTNFNIIPQLGNPMNGAC
jgi:hypothetical protein